jgi:hypothetical protein
MSTLSSLKLTALQKPTKPSASFQRRIKLSKRICEQIELAKAQQAGTHYVATKIRTIKDADTGVRSQVEESKRVKAWWFTADNGKIALNVRYGAKVLELAKGKCAIEVATDKELVNVLEVVNVAVLNGELDTAIDNASVKLREGFAK